MSDNQQARTEKAKQRLDAYLSRITYKPEVKITTGITRHGADYGEAVAVRLERTVEDSYHPGSKVVQVWAEPIGVYEILRYDEEFLDHFIQSMFLSFEAHETNEWIRKDGKLLNDPHARIGTRHATEARHRVQQAPVGSPTHPRR